MKILICGCSFFFGMMVSAGSPQKLEPFGLENKRVTAIAMAAALSPREYLYAITESDGVYRRNLSHPDSDWTYLGLEGKNLIALDVQVWGAGPAVFETPVVVRHSNYMQSDSTLIYRLENQTWVASDSGILRHRYLAALASFASAGHEAPGFTFAVGGDFVYRSNTRSRSWEKIRGQDAIHAPDILALAIKQNEASREIWIGGDTGPTNFLPWIARSTDFGNSWQYFGIGLNLGLENTCWAFAFHPTEKVVYAGMSDAVIKTMDDGVTWQFTGLRDLALYAGVNSLSIDPFNAHHIYAASSFKPWLLWESFNDGSNWTMIPNNSSLVITKVAAAPHTAGVIYIATYGNGVWKYNSRSVAVAELKIENLSEHFGLAQNVPNPFSRNAAQVTVMRYQLVSTQNLKVEIYDVLGKRVTTLVDRVHAAGEYTAQWNGKDAAGKVVPNGIYFYRLIASTKTVAVRKMILMQ